MAADRLPPDGRPTWPWRPRPAGRGAPLCCRRSRTCCSGPSSAGHWSIPGTSWVSAANTASFPPSENSVYDHRVDELIELVGEVFDLYARSRRRRPPPETAELATTARRPDGGPGRLVGPVRHDRSRRDRRAFPAARPASRPITWPRRWRAWHEAGTAAGDLGLLARAMPSSSARPRPMPWWSSPAGARRSGGRHGPVGPLAEPGRRDPAGRRELFFPRPGAGLDGGTLVGDAVGASTASATASRRADRPTRRAID